MPPKSPERERALVIIRRELELDPEKTATQIINVLRAEVSLSVGESSQKQWVTTVRRSMGIRGPTSPAGQKKPAALKWDDETAEPPQAEASSPPPADPDTGQADVEGAGGAQAEAPKDHTNEPEQFMSDEERIGKEIHLLVEEINGLFFDAVKAGLQVDVAVKKVPLIVGWKALAVSVARPVGLS